MIIDSTLQDSVALDKENAIREKAYRLRSSILDVSYVSGEGHIGSALSIADIMAVLWGEILHAPGSSFPGRDRFILGKGHAALALYACLHDADLMSTTALHSYCKEGSEVCAHPIHRVTGVDISTGSLGQSLSIGCGIALALRHRSSTARVAVLLSDAECNEGQIWEAASFAGHHGLDNLCAIVDENGSQGMGRTCDILRINSPDDVWGGFGWETVRVEGNDVRALRESLREFGHSGPKVVFAQTKLGKGVSFMEDDYHWHYSKMTKEDYSLARASLEE